jgi:3-oxoacyl-[acyl-carrier-protein] synthase III
MAMTKKDYELVAKALRTQKEAIVTRSNIQSRIIDETAETMAAHFALMNDKFNKDTFLEAAGHGENFND